MPGPFWVLVNGTLTFTGTSSVTTQLLGNGTAAAPSLAFASAPGYGFFFGNATFQWSANGSVRGALAALVTMNSAGGYSWTSTTLPTDTVDLQLLRDGPGTLGQRNAANGQIFNVYNTYTSGTDYERLEIGANAGGQGANVFGIVPTKGTSGTLRTLNIGSSIGTLVLNSSRVSLIGQVDFPGTASTFAQTATITNGPRAANPVNWVKVKYNSGASSGRMPIW